MNSQSCPICLQPTKTMKMPHTFHTRIPNFETVTVNELTHNQCTVCHYCELTPESRDLVQRMTDFYVRRYQEEPTKPDSLVRSVLKSWRN